MSIDKDLKNFEKFVDDHTFEIYEGMKNAEPDTKPDIKIPGFWYALKNFTNFSIRTNLGNVITVNGEVGFRNRTIE